MGKISFTEREIQDYIWSNRESFDSFLDEPVGLDIFKFEDDLSNVSAHNLIRNRINKKLEEFHAKLCSIKLIGCEVPLEQQSNSTIRADFLATFPGDTGVGIIELKKSEQTERQAFTELLAYSNHLTTLFPAMSREDSVYILISPMETRIARDAVIQTLTFDNRKIVALIPYFDDPSNITSLRLKLWIPTDNELATFSHVIFKEDNFSVCKIVWEYDEERWDAPKGENPSAELREQFNSISTIAAQKMEESGIHGFVYCSQLWSELSEKFPYTNSLVLVGLNPYAAASAQYLVDNIKIKPSEIPAPLNYLPNICDLIKKGVPRDDNEDTMFDLYAVWSSQLSIIGRSVVEAVTQTTDGKKGDIDQGFLDWEEYQWSLLEDVYCHNFLVRPTGLLRRLYEDVTDLDYKASHFYGLTEHPIHGDMPYLGVDYLTSQSYFRFFIRRMFHTDETELAGSISEA
ncbi:hypothetical protein [Aeromonas veronii]|uniref:hypothetical protein n=1 Tax=Aeromonas veronii TaxID=654 RepID=UPI003BA3C218